MNRLLTAAFACLALVGCATTPAQRDEVATSAEPAARAFMESSLVLVPETVGEFRLVSSNDYPGHPEWGAGMRYAHPDFPDVLVDLYVFPVGRTDSGDALDSGMAQFRGELSAMTDQGRYTDLAYGDETAFNLASIGADGRVESPDPSPGKGPDEAAAPPDDEQEILAAIAGVEASLDPAVGRKLPLRFARDGEPLDSVAYLFYRGLYLYKGRVSTSARAMPQDSFDRFANHAMARLVPAVAVRSTGGCHQTTISVNPDASPEQMQTQLMLGAAESLARSENEGCAERLDPTVPSGHRGIRLEFPPSMWR